MEILTEAENKWDGNRTNHCFFFVGVLCSLRLVFGGINCILVGCHYFFTILSEKDEESLD
jgi:hypothetical protein